MRRVLCSSLAGGALLFVRGLLIHVAIGCSDAVYHHFSDEKAITGAIDENTPVRDLYSLPHRPES